MKFSVYNNLCNGKRHGTPTRKRLLRCECVVYTQIPLVMFFVLPVFIITYVICITVYRKIFKISGVKRTKMTIVKTRSL
jgi:hypothetical protein